MTDLAVTASRLLKQFGEPVTLTDGEAAAAEFDPVTGDPITPDAPLLITANGYPSRYEANEIDGETVRSGDIRLIVEITEPRPQVGWAVTVDGVTYRAMNVKAIRRSGRDQLNIVQLRAN